LRLAADWQLLEKRGGAEAAWAPPGGFGFSGKNFLLKIRNHAPVADMAGRKRIGWKGPASLRGAEGWGFHPTGFLRELSSPRCFGFLGGPRAAAIAEIDKGHLRQSFYRRFESLDFPD